METWQSQYGDLAKIIDYGKSVRGRTLRMLLVMKQRQQEMSIHPTLLMSGSTHGDEYLNIEDRLPEEILRKSRNDGPVRDFLNQGGAFIFVPILNPDGYEARTRENANGEDLNRDWDVTPAGFKGFREIETKSLAEKIQALTQSPYNLRIEMTVDYHCCVGAILYPWSYTKAPLPPLDLAAHIQVSEIAKEALDIGHGTTNDILGYMPVGTTKDYYYDHYGALSFTFEGRYESENMLLPKHVQWWEKTIAKIVDNAPFQARTPNPVGQFFRIATGRWF